VDVWAGGGSIDTINVHATGLLGASAANLTTVHTISPNSIVNVGNGNTLAGINGPLMINALPFITHVYVNDSADNSNHLNVVLTATQLSGLSPSGAGTINFGPTSLAGLTISVGDGTNTYNVVNTQAGAPPAVVNLTTLNTGRGADTVNVKGTTGPLIVNAAGHADAVVNVGNAGSLAGINGALTLNNGPSWSHVNVDDSADMSGHPNVTLTDTALANLAPATISFGANSLAGLTITGGSGANTYTIVTTQASTVPLGNLTILNTGGGADTVNVQGAAAALLINSASGSGADAITLGDAANTLGGIAAPVTINAAATDTLTLNDQGTAADRTYTVGAAAVSWSGGTAAVSYTGAGALKLNGGGGNDTYNLTGTSATAALTVVAGPGSNTAVGSNAGNLWYLAGANAGSLSGPAYASPASFTNVASLTAGTGGDTFQFADGAMITGDLTGGGADTLDYSAYSTSVVVDLQLSAAGTDTGVGGTVSGIATVYGGSAAPAGPGVYNLLIGNGGAYLQGGTGRRNILVAGGSISTLVGGDGEDLLIAGTTSYDSQAGLANWQAIAAYWAGPDDFATRAANLLGGSGVPALDPTPGTGTVTGNGGGNILTGNGGRALIFNDGLNAISGFDPSWQEVTITP
jgi:hypothetical protein